MTRLGLAAVLRARLAPWRPSARWPAQPMQMQPYSSQEARDYIRKVVGENDVVVFMKGTPRAPMCGFSRTVCKILEHQGLPAFATVNVLDDEDIRQEVKLYTRWPTIPQVFIKGTFVGGCDIMLDMNQSGQLRQLLRKEGLLGGDQGPE